MSAFGWLNPFGWFGYTGHVAQIVEPASQEKSTPEKPVDRSTSLLYGGSAMCLPCYADAPPLTDNTMRAMSAHSTLAFIFANIVKPITAATITCEIEGWAKDKFGAAEMEKRQKVMDASVGKHIIPAVRSACRALQYGRWTQETIFDRVDGYTVPVEFKSFLPWEIRLLKDKYRNFAGCRFNSVDVDARYLYHHVNDPELDPIFGYSRHANVLPEWWQKLQDKIQLAKLAVAAHAIVPIVKGPTGSPVGIDGKTKTGLQTCKDIAAALARGEPVYMPQYLLDETEINPSNPEIVKFTAFDIDTVDLGNKGPAILALMEKMAYEDVSMSRGWHQPERASMEGSHGTKAEAGVHKSTGIEDSECVFGDAVRSFNLGPVNQTLITNWGPEAAGSIYFKPSQLQDPDKEFKQSMITAGMTGQSGADMLIEVDKRSLMEEQEVPLLDEAAVKKLRAVQEQKQADAAKQQQSTGANGNGKVNGNGSAAKLAAAVTSISRIREYMREDDEL